MAESDFLFFSFSHHLCDGFADMRNRRRFSQMRIKSALHCSNRINVAAVAAQSNSFEAAQSRTLAMEAAKPRHSVLMGQRTYCMVS